MAGVNRCFAVSLYRMAAGHEIPAIYVGAGATEGCCLGGLYHVGYIPVPDDIKYFVSTCRKDVRGGAAEFLKASPDLGRALHGSGRADPPAGEIPCRAGMRGASRSPCRRSFPSASSGTAEHIRNMAALVHFDRDDPFSPVIVPVGLVLLDIYHVPGRACGKYAQKYRVHGPAGPHPEPFAPSGNDGAGVPRGDGRADGREPRCIVCHPGPQVAFPRHAAQQDR